MRLSGLLVVAVLLPHGPAFAQEARARQRTPSAQGESTARTAVPRDEASRREAAPPPAPAPRAAAVAPSQDRVSAQQERRARPRGDRPRGDNPQTGVAVPRRSAPPRGDGSGIFIPSRRAYSYYYPRDVYPYGYGAFGLGYFYYDPYAWGPSYGYGNPGYGAGAYGYGYPTGELRLQVQPREAAVHVDGYYAGTVDEFDGFFQSLRLTEGGYRIEITAPGYEPLTFDVRILPGRKTTYRGELLRQP